MSGLRETFMKIYRVERSNKSEIRPEEQSEKAESCRVNLWNEIQLKGRVCVMISFRPAVYVCGQSFDVAICFKHHECDKCQN